MAADRPDRDLRFLLGHAFTLDKLRLRLAEIEDSSSSDEGDISDEDDGTMPTCTGSGPGHSQAITHEVDAPVQSEPRRVSFSNTNRPDVAPRRQSSPPPNGYDGPDTDSDDDSDDGIYDDYDNEETLGLQRFGSAAAQPPRLVDDDSDDDDVAEPSSPTEEELRMITGGEANAELLEKYSHVAGCPCHGLLDKDTKAERMWELPQKPGHVGPRMAIVEVAA